MFHAISLVFDKSNAIGIESECIDSACRLVREPKESLRREKRESLLAESLELNSPKIVCLPSSKWRCQIQFSSDYLDSIILKLTLLFKSLLFYLYCLFACVISCVYLKVSLVPKKRIKCNSFFVLVFVAHFPPLPLFE